MRYLSICLLALFLATGCSKDDKDNDDQNDSENQSSSFALVSSDSTLNINGDAILAPGMGIDSLISISMSGSNGQSAVFLNLYNSPVAWNANNFSLSDTNNRQNFFTMTLSVDSLSTGLVAVNGQIDITEKQEGEYIAGDMNVLLMNPANQDSVQTSGSFYAKSSY